MSGCRIVGENAIINLLVRYDGIGDPLTSDDREILLFALRNESLDRGGIVAKAEQKEAEIVQRLKLKESL